MRRREGACGKFQLSVLGVGEENEKVCINVNRGGDVVGLNPSIRIYRYTKGQFFDCHCKSISLR